MNIFYLVYIHVVTCRLAPKGYIKYMWYCLTHCKKPKTNVLAKLVMMRRIAEETGLRLAKKNKSGVTRTPKVQVTQLRMHNLVH